MFAWWNSVDVVTTLSTYTQWTVAIAGVAALVFSLRASTLKERADEAERQRMASQLKVAQNRAEDALAKLQPRSATPQQREAFLAVAVSMPKGQVAVLSIMGNAESTQYAQQLAEVLKVAGYQVHESDIMPLGASMPTGLGLTVKRGEPFPPHTDGLELAFLQARVPIVRGYGGPHKDNTVNLYVGVKP